MSVGSSVIFGVGRRLITSNPAQKEFVIPEKSGMTKQAAIT
jgi:hypothetical protein